VVQSVENGFGNGRVTGLIPKESKKWW